MKASLEIRSPGAAQSKVSLYIKILKILVATLHIVVEHTHVVYLFLPMYVACTIHFQF